MEGCCFAYRAALGAATCVDPLGEEQSPEIQRGTPAGRQAADCHATGARPKRADKTQTRISCLKSKNPQQDRRADSGKQETELYVSLLPPPRQVQAQGRCPQGAVAAAAGEGSTSPPFLVLYFTFLVSLPCVDVNISTHPFAWKPHFHKMTRRDAFPTLGELWETAGFSSAIARQMLHGHLKHGDTCQKPRSNARGHRWRHPRSPLQALAAKLLHRRRTRQVPASTQISSTAPGADPFGKPRQNTHPI